jgi:outer membrane protein OmpA-like peptidoglycan-associated protein
MLLRFALCAFVALTLSACSTTPDRYAFWKDNSAPETGAKPNLADVPAAPNVADAKAEMDTMRQRLQQDRDNAYLAAQGVIPMESLDTAPPASPAPPTVSGMMEPMVMDDMPPPSADGSLPPMDAPPPAYGFDPAAPMPVSGGNVQYNYAPTPGYETYVYGYSPVQINRQSAYQQQASQLMAANDSVSIDFSALSNGMPEQALSPVGMLGKPLVYFKHGSSRLGSLDKKRIADLAEQLKRQPATVVIIGHASKPTGLDDKIASEDVNLRMSAQRASVVLRELARHGVSADQVRITAQGDSSPAAPTPGLTPEAADRRVEILFDR